jgi:hypothetical protein
MSTGRRAFLHMLGFVTGAVWVWISVAENFRAFYQHGGIPQLWAAVLGNIASSLLIGFTVILGFRFFRLVLSLERPTDDEPKPQQEAT